MSSFTCWNIWFYIFPRNDHSWNGGLWVRQLTLEITVERMYLNLNLTFELCLSSIFLARVPHSYIIDLTLDLRNNHQLASGYGFPSMLPPGPIAAVVLSPAASVCPIITKFTWNVYHGVGKPLFNINDLDLDLQGHLVLLLISAPSWDACLPTNLWTNKYSNAKFTPFMHHDMLQNPLQYQ